MKIRTKYIMVVVGFPITALGMLSAMIKALFMGGRLWMFKKIAGVYELDEDMQAAIKNAHLPGTVPHYQLGKPVVWLKPKGDEQ